MLRYAKLNPKKPKILLLTAPYARLKGLFTKNFPIGLGYIAAVLEKRGYSVKIYCSDNNMANEDERFYDYLGSSAVWQNDMLRHQKFVSLFDENIYNYDYIWNDIREIIKDYSPDVVGISTTTTSYLSALVIARIVKDFDKSIHTIFGGVHPSVLPDEVLAERDVDFVIRGEGEFALPELLDALYGNADFADVRGLSFKLNKKIIHNPCRGFIENLDGLPLPARHLLINKIDRGEKYVRGLFSNIMVARGCPYDCKFCAANSIWKRSWHIRSVEKVLEEIKLLIERYKVRQLEILSDTLCIDKKWVMNFCEEIKPLDINWGCATRINTLDEDILKAMKKSGCNHIWLGLESGSDKILRTVRKGFSVSQTKKVTHFVNKSGIPWTALFMIGFPEETAADIKNTLSVMKKLKPWRHKPAILAPYPGTEYYAILKSSKRLPERLNWNLFDGRTSHLTFTENIPRDRFIKLRDSVFKYADYYNRMQPIRDKWKLAFNNPLLFSKKALGFVASRIMRFLRKYLLAVEKKKFLTEYEAEKTEKVEPLTFAEFKKMKERYPLYLGSYYKDRWSYIKEVIAIIKRERPKKVLELGAYAVPIVKGSDTMDKEIAHPKLTYHHDATKFPWPIKEAGYDLFIALQVWEHLEDKQKEAFKEVMRVSKAAILSFPYKWDIPGDCHHGIDDEKIAEWTLHVEPEEKITVADRIIYFFRF